MGGGEIFNIYEGIIYGELLKVSPFKKVLEKLIYIKLKYEEYGIDLMVDLKKLCMNSLYGLSIGEDIDGEDIIRSGKSVLKKTMKPLLILNPHEMMKMLLNLEAIPKLIKQKKLKKVCHLI